MGVSMDKDISEDVGGLQKIKGHALSSIATLILTVIMLRTDIMKAENNELNNAYTRISHLETNMNIMNDTLLKQSAEIASLKIQLGMKFNPQEYIGTYLNAIDKPAWVKEWDGHTFRMLIINQAYANYFGVSKEKYKGAEDKDIYDSVTAEIYFRNDLRTLAYKGFVEYVETIQQPGKPPRQVTVWKFYLKLPSGKDAVGGIVID
jgi:hypothetical protein